MSFVLLLAAAAGTALCLVGGLDDATFAAGGSLTVLLATGGAPLWVRPGDPEMQPGIAPEPFVPRALPPPLEAAAERELSREALALRLRESAAALEQMQEEFDAFHASVSHDLRSPLGAIVNLVAILSEDAHLDDLGRECVRRIESSARAALSLADGVAAYVRSGRDALRPEPVAMNAVFEREAARLVALRAPDARVAIAPMPDAVADPPMAHAIAAHLLDNALKFARAGEPAQVSVGGEIAGDELVYWVGDRGIGVDARYADRLFVPFQRLHGNPAHPGHGLGLAIVARLVRRHGGRVWAEGARDGGARFSFSLPKR